MTPYSIAALGLLGLVPALGCSGGSGPSTPSNGAPACNPCDADSGAVQIGQGTNPDGVPYPNPPTGYGRVARNGGSQPGSIMQNFKFLGYRDAIKTTNLQTIALADYFDPCQKKYSMLHITVAAVWCTPCNMETDAIVAAKAMLDSEHVAFLQALDDGPVMNVNATRADLDFWIGTHKSNFTETLDPGLNNLGGFFNAAEVPWNADIDVRTMEILHADVGYEDPALNLTTQYDQATKQAPMYALAVSCP